MKWQTRRLPALGDTARDYSNEVVEGIREKATEAGQAVRHAAEEAKGCSDRLARDLARTYRTSPLAITADCRTVRSGSDD